MSDKYKIKVDKSAVFHTDNFPENTVEEVEAFAEAHKNFLNNDDTPDWFCPEIARGCRVDCISFRAARVEMTVNDKEWTVHEYYCNNPSLVVNPI